MANSPIDGIQRGTKGVQVLMHYLRSELISAVTISFHGTLKPSRSAINPKITAIMIFMKRA